MLSVIEECLDITNQNINKKDLNHNGTEKLKIRTWSKFLAVKFS